MQDSDAPTKIPLKWAATAAAPYVNAIPTSSQPGGRASFSDGFPPPNFVPRASGGIPPWGADANGIMQQITAGLQWLQMGGPQKYDASFQGLIGGYPKNALIASSTTDGLWWLSTAENNITNPDTGGAGWTRVPIDNVQSARTRIDAATNYYVNFATGSDSTGDGTSGNPWKTLQHAYDTLAATVDGGGQTITINQNAAGIDTTGLVISVPILACSFLNLVIDGGILVAADNCILMNTSAAGALVISGSGELSAAAGSAIWADTGATVAYSGITFGACGTSHVLVGSNATVLPNGNYTIAGDAPWHWFVNGAGSEVHVQGIIDVTLSGSHAFATAFAQASNNGIINAPKAGTDHVVFTGSATGVKFLTDSGGGINTNSGDVNFLPGGSAGTATSPGWYL